MGDGLPYENGGVLGNTEKPDPAFRDLRSAKGDQDRPRVEPEESPDGGSLSNATDSTHAHGRILSSREWASRKHEPRSYSILARYLG